MTKTFCHAYKVAFVISKNNPKTVLLNIDGFAIKVVLKWEGYELFVDNQLVDEWKGM
jgi:hypothetical protein